MPVQRCAHPPWALDLLRQGYVHRTDSAFFIKEFEQLSDPGGTFDPNGPFLLANLPVVIHSTIIMILNQYIYRRIATTLTRWENHKTEDDFENALIIKR
jgi:hypothetical protein